MTISEAQQRVNEWITSTGIRYFNELTNMAMLTEEVGEVARIIARKYGEQSFRNGEDETSEQDLADELADVLFVIICLANQTGVDLTEALKKNIEKKTNFFQCYPLPILTFPIHIPTYYEENYLVTG